MRVSKVSILYIYIYIEREREREREISSLYYLNKMVKNIKILIFDIS